MFKKIKVLVIDDSIFMRQMISDILNADPNIEALDTAINGEDGLIKIEKLNPDVVTLDYEMPGLNGIATLKKIMNRHSVPVVMISAHTKEGGEITLEALAQGAVDYILKPSGTVSLNIKKIAGEIVEKVKMAAGANLKALKYAEIKNRGTTRKLTPKESKLPTGQALKNAEWFSVIPREFPRISALAIGSSTGGTKGVELILESLPAEFPAPILIVQHMPEMFTALFADRLNRLAKIKVKEGEDGEEVKAGVAYIAPGGWHMKVKSQKSKVKSQIELTKEPAVFGLRPSVDILMKSVAEVYGANSVGVILSGMGSDGAEGLGKIFEAGGKTIAQDEKTSVVFGMPRRAIEAGVVDDVLPVGEIAGAIMKALKH